MFYTGESWLWWCKLQQQHSEADTRTTVLSLRLALAYTLQSKAAKVRHNTVSKKKYMNKKETIYKKNPSTKEIRVNYITLDMLFFL